MILRDRKKSGVNTRHSLTV